MILSIYSSHDSDDLFHTMQRDGIGEKEDHPFDASIPGMFLINWFITLVE